MLRLRKFVSFSRTTDEIAMACVVGTCFKGIYAFVCFVFVRGALRASEIIISQSAKMVKWVALGKLQGQILVRFMKYHL